MKVTKILFLSLILFTGCSILLLHSNATKDNMYLLSNDSIKYWADIWKDPFFDTQKEGGLAFSKDSTLMVYQLNNDNKRVIVIGSEYVICNQTTFKIKSDTLFIYKCGGIHILKIMKLSADSLELKEITPYGFFPDFGMPKGTIPILYIRSKDQSTRPIKDYTDYKNGPVEVYPILH